MRLLRLRQGDHWNLVLLHPGGDWRHRLLDLLHHLRLAASGLSLNTSTGVISGKPTTAGTYTFTSKVVDSKGYSDTSVCAIIVQAPTIDLECGSCGTAKATLNKSYSEQLQVIGGKSAFTFSIVSGSLPSGLSLNTRR